MPQGLAQPDCLPSAFCPRPARQAHFGAWGAGTGTGRQGCPGHPQHEGVRHLPPHPVRGPALLPAWLLPGQGRAKPEAVGGDRVAAGGPGRGDGEAGGASRGRAGAEKEGGEATLQPLGGGRPLGRSRARARPRGRRGCPRASLGLAAEPSGGVGTAAGLCVRGGGPGHRPPCFTRRRLCQRFCPPTSFTPQPVRRAPLNPPAGFAAQVKSLKSPRVPLPPGPGLSCTLTPGDTAPLLTRLQGVGEAGEQVNVEAAALAGGAPPAGPPTAQRVSPPGRAERGEGQGRLGASGSGAGTGGRKEAGPEVGQELWAAPGLGQVLSLDPALQPRDPDSPLVGLCFWGLLED